MLVSQYLDSAQPVALETVIVLQVLELFSH